MGSEMNHETIVSVDEATKKFMGFINEEISANINDGIHGALRKTNNDLAEMTEKANALLASAKSTSKTVENIPSVIEQFQKKIEQVIVNEFLKNQKFQQENNENTKTAILTEQKIADGTLRKIDSNLEGISKKANTILLSVEDTSKTSKNISSAIEQTQKNTEQIILRESIKNQQLHKEINEGTKTAILTEQKMVIKEIAKLNETYSKNQEEILAKLLAFEEKLSGVNTAIEDQALVLKRLEKIEEKINYLKIPFYKRWFNKGVD